MANNFIENKHIIDIATRDVPSLYGSDKVEIPHQHPFVIQINVQIIDSRHKLITQLTLTWAINIKQKPLFIIMN